MAEVILVMQWLRPHLERERRVLEGLQQRAEEIRALAQPHYGCTVELLGDCRVCELNQLYRDMAARDMREIQDRVQGAVALTASCRGM